MRSMGIGTAHSLYPLIPQSTVDKLSWCIVYIIILRIYTIFKISRRYVQLILAKTNWLQDTTQQFTMVPRFYKNCSETDKAQYPGIFIYIKFKDTHCVCIQQHKYKVWRHLCTVYDYKHVPHRVVSTTLYILNFLYHFQI